MSESKIEVKITSSRADWDRYRCREIKLSSRKNLSRCRSVGLNSVGKMTYAIGRFLLVVAMNSVWPTVAGLRSQFTTVRSRIRQPIQCRSSRVGRSGRLGRSVGLVSRRTQQSRSRSQSGNGRMY